MNLILILGILLSGVSSTGFTEAQINRELEPLALGLSEIAGEPIALEDVFGEIHFEWVKTEAQNYSCWSSLKCYGATNPLDDEKARGLLVHELGHKFLNMQGLTFSELDLNISYGDVHITGINSNTGKYERTSKGFISSSRPYMQHPPSVPETGQTYQEDFADMFMAYFLGYFSDDIEGKLRYKWMDNFIREHLEVENGQLRQRDIRTYLFGKGAEDAGRMLLK